MGLIPLIALGPLAYFFATESYRLLAKRIASTVSVIESTIVDHKWLIWQFSLFHSRGLLSFYQLKLVIADLLQFHFIVGSQSLNFLDR